MSSYVTDGDEPAKALETKKKPRLLSCLFLLWLTLLMREQNYSSCSGCRLLCELVPSFYLPTVLGVGTWQVQPFAAWQPTRRSTLPEHDDGAGLRRVPSFAAA